MRGELKHLQYTLNTTTVYVTHDQAEAMTLGHRVAVMHKGRLQQFDAPLQIYNQPVNRFVAEFVGSPAMNFLDGRTDRDAGTFITTDGLTVSLDEDQLRALASTDQHVSLGIRPDHLEISLTPRDRWIQATVYVTELMGSETFVFLQVGSHRIVARAPADFRGDVGANIFVNPRAKQTHFFDGLTGVRIGP